MGWHGESAADAVLSVGVGGRNSVSRTFHDSQ